MAGPATVPLLIIGSTAVGVATSARAASQQNRYVEQGYANQEEAARLQARQLGEQEIALSEQRVVTIEQLNRQADIERMKRVNEADQIRGRLRVAAGAAGVGMGGSFGALERQSEFDESANLAILEGNREIALRSIESQYSSGITSLRSGFNAAMINIQSNLIQLASQRTNPILQGFMGGMQGLQTGLQITGLARQEGLIE